MRWYDQQLWSFARNRRLPGTVCSKRIPEEEAITIGLGSYKDKSTISENKIRLEHRLKLRVRYGKN